MAITETIKSSAYRVWSTALGHWKKYSLWNLAKDTEFDDGNNAETKVGAINGITSSLVANDSSVAASSAAVYELNKNLAARTASILDYSRYTIEQAISLVISNNFSGYSGCVMCQIISSDGEYFVSMRVASTRSATGIAQYWGDGTTYSFKKKAGADAVLKKLGSGTLEVFHFQPHGTTASLITLPANSILGICTTGAYPSQWTFTINGVTMSKNTAFMYETGDSDESLIFKNTHSNPGACGLVIFKLTE